MKTIIADAMKFASAKPLPFEKLNIEQLRFLMFKLGKAYAGMSKPELVRTLCALTGYKP